MIVGMVLLVVAVVGVIFAAGSLVSVGQLENTLGTDIFDDENDVNEMTVLELVQALVGDLQNLDGLTINKLRQDYGLKIPEEISGIDISVLFDYPVKEVPDHLGDVVNNMTLRDVGEFLEMDFGSYELPIIDENLDNNVNVALDNILSSIDDENMTVYSIGQDFGLSLGENNLITTLRHTPLNAFADVMDNLPVGVVTDADSDLFLTQGENALYVGADRYEEVSAEELSSSAVTDGAETYIAGADDNGLVYRELRYVANGDGTYSVDNSCYSSSFDATANDKTFYRHIVYEAYDADAVYGEGTEFFAEAYLNCFVSDGEGGFVLASDGMFSLAEVYTDEGLSVTLNDAVLSGAVTVSEGKIDLSSLSLYVAETADDGSVHGVPAADYGLADGTVPADDSRLDDRYEGWVRVHVGTADPAMQVIAGETISSVSGATDKITALKLGEVLDIDENSAKILQTLKDTPIKEMSEALDTVTLSDATDIVMSTYTEAKYGSYVLVTSETGGTYYTLYNPSDPSHAGLTRYERTSVDGESSAALQRLADVAIPDISAAFSDMVLGDALNVETDTFVPVAESSLTEGETYYVFNAEFGYPERVVYHAADYDPDYDLPDFYERTYEGEGNAVLKQLAYVNIDDVSLAMDEIIQNTLLADIIDVVEYSVVREDADGDSWLIRNDPAYTETADGVSTYYTYVYDGSGSFYLSDVLFLSATDSQLTGGTELTFGYKPYTNDTSANAAAFVAAHGANIYFRNDKGGYEANPALVAYYVANDNLAALKAAYYRTQDADASDTVTVTVYDNVTGLTDGSGLYVISNGAFNLSDGQITASFGSYVPYDPADPTHWGEELYFKYTDGYYLASSDEALADETRYSFSFDSGIFSAAENGEYIKLSPRTEENREETLYYFSSLDAGYKEGYTRYSKRECDVIFMENENGGWVNFGGEYVEYDAANGDHEGLTRYDRVIGYIGNDAANTGGTGLDPLSDVRVSVVEEKSPTILLSLLDRQITVGGMNDAVNTLTLEELMEIEEGSVFDNPLLRGSTIEDLSANVSAMFTEMTIGELLVYSNISVSSEISYILQDVMLADFFGALEYDAANGTIVVNMERLFGIV